MAANNLNVNRVLTDGVGGYLDYQSIAIDSQTSGNPPVFQRAVVEEIIFDPKNLSASDKERIRSAVVNSSAVETISANSVVAIMINDGMSNSVPTRVLLSPFFQSHFMLPVQIGEQITVVFEDTQKFGFFGGKWITRVSEGLPVEDVNFTHGDRRYNNLYLTIVGTSESLNRISGSYSPNFQNGGGRENTFSIPQNSNTNPYDTLFDNNQILRIPHSYEVVPRWTKRPQELVIQGMNNALIMLGQDRIGQVNLTSSNINIEQKNYAGTIDMVAGRSRYILDPKVKELPRNINELNHRSTSPFVVTNSRGLQEVDKFPQLNGRRQQIKEGDPDFIHDAARIYISMKTLGDTNFRLKKTEDGNPSQTMQETGINYSPNSLYPIQFSSSSARVGTSYIVNKADHVRLIGRRSIPQEDNIENPDIISGSVLIIKEGNFRTPEDIDAQANDGDHLAYLYMSPEGRVQIDGLQIFLGGAAINTNPAPADKTRPVPDTPRNSDGSNSEITIGTENRFAGAEPYIKWSEFKKVVEGLQQQITSLQNAYSGLVQDINNATGQSTCVPFAPDTAWIPLAANLNGRNSTLESNILTHRTATNQAVYRSRSAKIFGQ